MYILVNGTLRKVYAMQEIFDVDMANMYTFFPWRDCEMRLSLEGPPAIWLASWCTLWNQRLGWHGMIFRWWGEDGSKQKKRFIFNRRGWGLWEIEWFDLQVWSSANLTSYDVRLSSLFKSSRWNKKKWEPKGPQKPSFLLELWRLKEERLFFPLVFGTQNYTKPVILSVQHAHDAWFVFTFAGLNPWFAIKGFW